MRSDDVAAGCYISDASVMHLNQQIDLSVREVLRSHVVIGASNEPRWRALIPARLGALSFAVRRKVQRVFCRHTGHAAAGPASRTVESLRGMDNSRHRGPGRCIHGGGLRARASEDEVDMGG